VTEAPRGQRLEADVVLGVRGRDDDVRRAGGLEHRTFESRQPARLDVLDDLHEDRRVVSRQARVPVRERALQQAEALALALVHPLEAHAP
jgi:hypothetical protein